MFYIYVLRNSPTKKLYTGLTSDLSRRIREHVSHKVRTTKNWDKCELIFYEAFRNKKDAEKRERYLKSAKGKRTLRLMLYNNLLE